MGSLCCFSCGDGLEEYAYPSNSSYRSCLWLRFYFSQFFNGNGATSYRLEGRSATASEASTSLVPQSAVGGLPEGSVVDIHASLENEQRCIRLPRDGLIARKLMANFQEDSQQPGRNGSSSGVESLAFGKKRNIACSDKEKKLGRYVSSDKVGSKKLVDWRPCTGFSSEEEDVCPTCLDEYTSDNPKITAHCTHHFHLGCIYEWLERSDDCPICGQGMEFCESP